MCTREDHIAGQLAEQSRTRAAARFWFYRVWWVEVRLWWGFMFDSKTTELNLCPAFRLRAGVAPPFAYYIKKGVCVSLWDTLSDFVGFCALLLSSAGLTQTRDDVPHYIFVTYS